MKNSVSTNFRSPKMKILYFHNSQQMKRLKSKLKRKNILKKRKIKTLMVKLMKILAARSLKRKLKRKLNRPNQKKKKLKLLKLSKL